jgi:hypothetical protein
MDNNREEIIGHMKILLCPANPNRAEDDTPGVTHYVGVAGVGEDAARLPLDHPRAGVFGYDRQTRLEDLRRGGRKTLLVIETATNNGPWTAGGPATVRGLDPEGLPYLGAEGQFSSRHLPRVTHALFADGAVHPLSSRLSSQVLEALATIAGGETVAIDF